VPWSATYNAKLGVVEIVYEGTATRADLIAENEQSFALAREKNTRRFLIDLTDYESSLSTMALFDVAVSHKDEPLRPRAAVIQPTAGKAKEDAAFYETVCRNRGFDFRIFSARADAIKWLLADASTGPQRGTGT
jgi:hypothetical protein